MNAPLLAALLCAFSLNAAAATNQTPAPVEPAALSPDAAAESAVKDLEACVDFLDYYSKDLKKKEAELDKEFKDKVPSAYESLLKMKRGRVTRQYKECALIVKRGDKPLAASETELKKIFAGTADYTKSRTLLDELRGRLNKATKRFGAHQSP